MSRFTTFNGLLAQIWQQVITSLRDKLEEELFPNLNSAWIASVLLRVGLSPKEPEIRAYLVLLDNWVERLEVKAKLLDESSTGLLGLWIYLRHQQRKRVNNHLENLFLRSVEHNLEKSKDLSLGTNVDLLSAVAAGLRSTSLPAELQTRMSERLQALVRNANALELVQLLQSWELIQRTGDIPHMDVQHRLEAIAVDENNPVIQRAIAYYGQSRLAGLSGTPSIEYELRFLECLGATASSDLGKKGNSIVRAYTLFLPYLKQKLSYNSLLDSWQRYMDSSFKHAKTENYWARYLFTVCLAILALVTCWPCFRQLDSGFQISIGTAVATALLMLTIFTIEVTAELYGRQFWQKGRVEIFVLLLGAVILIAAPLVAALLK